MKDGVTFEIPVLPNMFGFNALDYCLPGAIAKPIDLDIFWTNGEALKDQLEILQSSENETLAEVIFEGIS